MSFFDMVDAVPKRNIHDNRVNVWNNSKIYTHDDPTYKQQARKAQDAAAIRSSFGSHDTKKVSGKVVTSLKNSEQAPVTTGGEAWGGSAMSGKATVGPTNFARNAPPGLDVEKSSASKTTRQGLIGSESGQPPHLRRPKTESSGAIDQPTKRAPRVASTPMNAGTIAKSAKLASKVPCTYMDCSLGFQNEKAMKKHKEEDHEYCRICNEDFDNFKELLWHKTITEDVHVCCRLCGQDFRSEGGRDRHERQAHSKPQHCKCVGCGLIFHKGSELVHHITEDLCTGKLRPNYTNRETMATRRIQAALQLEAQSQTPSKPNRAITGSQQVRDDDDTSVGGVLLEPHILDSQPPMGLDKPKLNENENEDADDAATDMIHFSSSGSSTSKNDIDSEFPTLGQAASMKGKKKESVRKEFTSLKISSPNPSSAWKPLFGTMESEPEAGKGTGVTMVDYRRAIIPGENGQQHLVPTDWDHMIFKRHDLTAQYDCPFKTCELSFLLVDDLKMHLTSGFHLGTDHRCLKCLKTFKSPSALVAHMESNSERCKVRDTEHFGRMLHIVSGGFLGVKGRASDGTLQICALDVAEIDVQAIEQKKLMPYDDPDYNWSL